MNRVPRSAAGSPRIEITNDGGMIARRVDGSAIIVPRSKATPKGYPFASMTGKLQIRRSGGGISTESKIIETRSPIDDQAVIHPATELLSLLHRDHDGFVSIVKADDQGRPCIDIAGIPAKDIGFVFPQFLEHLAVNSYFAVNGMQRTRGYTSKVAAKSSSGKPIRMGLRSKVNTHRLTAVWVDLDIYGAVDADMNPMPLSEHEAIARAHALVAAGLIPEWTVTMWSGGGVWLFWLLAEEGTEKTRTMTKAGVVSAGRPVAMYRDRAKAAIEIMRNFRSVFDRANMAPDAKAGDIARIARLPGSWNTKRDASVRFHVNRYFDTGLPIAYTMRHLIEFLGVGVEIGKRSKPKVTDPKHAEACRERRLKGLRTRSLRMIALADLRGGIREGCRNVFLYYYGILIRDFIDGDVRSGSRRPKLLDELRRVNAEHVNPSLPDDEVVSTWRSLQRERKHMVDQHARSGERDGVYGLRDQTIADDLRIMQSEAKVIGLRTWFGKIIDPDEPKELNQRQRRRYAVGLIRREVETNGGEVRSAEYYADMLRMTTGNEHDIRTIRRYIVEAVGIDPAAAKDDESTKAVRGLRGDAAFVRGESRVAASWFHEHGRSADEA